MLAGGAIPDPGFAGLHGHGYTPSIEFNGINRNRFLIFGGGAMLVLGGGVRRLEDSVSRHRRRSQICD